MEKGFNDDGWVTIGSGSSAKLIPRELDIVREAMSLYYQLGRDFNGRTLFSEKKALLSTLSDKTDSYIDFMKTAWKLADSVVAESKASEKSDK